MADNFYSGIGLEPGSVLLLKVSVAIDGEDEYNKSLLSNLLKFRTYFMEFYPPSARERLPACFAREFGEQVGTYVTLRDPNRNEIEVKVEKENGKVYFKGGWHRLSDVYNVTSGASVALTYLNPSLCLIKLKDVDNVKIEYPKHNPPLSLKLQR